MVPPRVVLSSTVFNVLMDIITEAELPQEAVCISYADNLFIQAPTHKMIQTALQVVIDVCNDVSLNVFTSKTKAYTNCRDGTDLTVNDEKTEYLCVYVSEIQGKIQEYEVLFAACKARVTTLKVMRMDFCCCFANCVCIVHKVNGL